MSNRDIDSSRLEFKFRRNPSSRRVDRNGESRSNEEVSEPQRIFVHCCIDIHLGIGNNNSKGIRRTTSSINELLMKNFFGFLREKFKVREVSRNLGDCCTNWCLRSE